MPVPVVLDLPVLDGLLLLSSSSAMVDRFTVPRTGVVLRIGVRLRGLDLGRLAIS